MNSQRRESTGHSDNVLLCSLPGTGNTRGQIHNDGIDDKHNHTTTNNNDDDDINNNVKGLVITN